MKKKLSKENIRKVVKCFELWRFADILLAKSRGNKSKYKILQLYFGWRDGQKGFDGHEAEIRNWIRASRKTRSTYLITL
jgi:hypothetical protein